MNIYAAHSSQFEYKEEFYRPLDESSLTNSHTIIFPHSEENEGLFNSYEFFNSGACDFVVAEVSQPSTGLGIELGWADNAGIPILCVHKEDREPTSALLAITNTVYSYKTVDEMVTKVKNEVEATL